MSKGDNVKICSALAYILIGIIWYFVDDEMKKNKTVKFHVKQGIVLLVFAIIWSIVINILFGMFLLTFMYFMWSVIWLLSYIPLVLAIIGILNVVNGKEKPLPIIGIYAKKLTF